MPSSSRLFVGGFVAILIFCASMTSSSAFAAKGAGGKSMVADFSQVSEYVWNSPNPAAPTWCLNEDDWHVRTWSGALNGTFATTERLCDYSLDFSGGIWWDAGGVGLQADLVVAGSLDDLAIVSPQGDSHHAVFVDSTTSRGVTLTHYQVCYVPAYAIASNTGGRSLAGGSWQVTLTGNVTHVSLTLRARMTDVPFQQQNCQPSQQFLV